MLESIIVFSIVGLAALWLARKFYKNIESGKKGASISCGCSGCNDSCPADNKPGQTRTGIKP